MRKITIVTGNKNKLAEWRKMLPDKVIVESIDVDLPEIQSLDLRQIVEDKAKKAFEIVKGPVVVEDVSAGLDDLAGLPGPFYKFFRESLGDVVLVRLSKAATNRVTVRCLAAYFDGKTMLFGDGISHGVVVEPRGENGFGFDPVVVIDGETKTMAEMSPTEKNKVSPRSKAISELTRQL